MLSDGDRQVRQQLAERQLSLSGAAHHLRRLGAGPEPLLPRSSRRRCYRPLRPGTAEIAGETSREPSGIPVLSPVSSDTEN